MLDIKNKNFYPKGRDSKDSDIAEIKDLINHLPLKRDMLIEYLHLIQDKYNQIRKKHLAALANLLKKPMAEELIFGKLAKGGHVEITCKDKKINFEFSNKQEVKKELA